MPDEDFELEHLRNRLIREVPELRRGMLAEMVRPMELLADAIGRRLDREVDDDVRMFAGATIGALVLVMPDEFDEEADPHAPLAESSRTVLERIPAAGAAPDACRTRGLRGRACSPARGR